MAVPVPYFGYSKVGRTIALNNLSYNGPTSFGWDFGDGTTSVEKNPTHTYAEEGFYQVSLTATNADGTSEPLVMVLGVGDMPDTLNSTIPELVNHYIPAALQAKPSQKEIFTYINYWQSYLQPLVSEPEEILPEDTHNEMRWPPLVNVLISQLVSYSILLNSLNKFLLMNGQQGINDVESGGTTTVVVERQIKSIETGPSKVEWYEGKTETAEDFQKVAEAYSSLMADNGAITFLMGGICQLASRLMIFLPMCDNPVNKSIAPIVVGRYRSRVLGLTPFGYVNKRLL